MCNLVPTRCYIFETKESKKVASIGKQSKDNEDEKISEKKINARLQVCLSGSFHFCLDVQYLLSFGISTSITFRIHE